MLEGEVDLGGVHDEFTHQKLSANEDRKAHLPTLAQSQADGVSLAKELNVGLDEVTRFGLPIGALDHGLSKALGRVHLILELRMRGIQEYKRQHGLSIHRLCLDISAMYG